MKTLHHGINWFFATLGELVSPNSCDLVVLKGKLDRTRLSAAIHKILLRHPILCRPLDPLRTAADPLPPLPIDLRFHTLPDEDAARIDEYLLRLIWDEPLAPGGRPIRFHVVETRERTYLQTLHTHVYADATACYALTEQLAAAYAGTAAPAAPAIASPIGRDDFGKADLLALLCKSMPLRKQLGGRIKTVAHTPRNLGTPFAGLATPKHQTPGRRRLARFVLSASETRRLREAARARGHSIHALFQLAFVRTAASFNHSRGVERPALRLWDFFSLRPRLGEAGDGYDCLALIYPVDLSARWSDSRVLSRCTRYVEKMRQGELLVHAQRLDRLAQDFARSPQPFLRMWPAIFNSNVFFTNPGICPSPLSSFGALEVLDYVTFPQLFSPADLMFVFSTFRDRLRILATYDEDAFGMTFHHALFEPFLRYLGKLAALDFGTVTTCDGFAASWNPTPERLLSSPHQTPVHEL